MYNINTFWWLVLAFCPKFWEVKARYEWYFVILSMQVQWQGYHGILDTLTHYLMQKNLFEFFALSAGRDAKTSGMSTGDRMQALAPEPPGAISTA